MGSVELGDPLSPPDDGSAKRSLQKSDKEVPQPSGTTNHPPFAIDQSNMFTLLGVEGTANAKKRVAKGATNAERRMETGKSSQPITTSEHIRGILVACTMPSAMQATTNTKRYSGAKFPQKHIAEHAAQYIAESQNFEMLADKGGNPENAKKNNRWANAAWYEYFGSGEKKSARAPANMYVAFACMIADLFISCFGNYREDGMRRARAFVNMLASAHGDVSGYSNMAMVNALGKIVRDKS